MDDLTTFANDAPRVMDPLIAASVASFGFVFIHPFLDGNGRLSRFIFPTLYAAQGSWKKGSSCRSPLP
jgi:Fic family protein